MKKKNTPLSDPKKAYFTQNWFYQMKNDLVWQKYFGPYIDKKFHYLEVGSFEGMSAHWVATFHPLARLTCIDTFGGSEEHKDHAKHIEAYFDHNMKPFGNRVKKRKGFSSDELRKLPKEHFDFIYIDGDHHAKSALEDAVLAFPLLKIGGFMIFDDYEWNPGTKDYSEYDCPKLGISAFLALYRGHYDKVHVGYQIIIQRKEYDEQATKNDNESSKSVLPRQGKSETKIRKVAKSPGKPKDN